MSLYWFSPLLSTKKRRDPKIVLEATKTDHAHFTDRVYEVL